MLSTMNKILQYDHHGHDSLSPNYSLDLQDGSEIFSRQGSTRKPSRKRTHRQITEIIVENLKNGHGVLEQCRKGYVQMISYLDQHFLV